jgi:hypothetical protein
MKANSFWPCGSTCPKCRISSRASFQCRFPGIFPYTRRFGEPRFVGTVLRDLKARLVGEIDVAGPDLARSLTDLGLVDEYRLYFRPFVLAHGTPFFAGPRPPLRLVASDLVGEGVIRLTYVPA